MICLFRDYSTTELYTTSLEKTSSYSIQIVCKIAIGFSASEL